MIINPMIHEKIKELSLKDTKTLSQIGIKLGEEYGELARAILPLDNAAGSHHRFSSKTMILEEIVDIILVAESLRHRLKISDARVEQMFHAKIMKWERLQTLPSDVHYPFEIHVTVDVVEDIELFREHCYEIGVKPISLALYTSERTLRDVMTSSTVTGNNADVIDEVERITLELEDRGYRVLRQKIETVPWHPHSLMEKSDDNYFEAHQPVTIDPSKTEDLYYFVKRYPGCHLSRNALKRTDDGGEIFMITMRHNDCDLDQFKVRYTKLRDGLTAAGYDVSPKKIIEWAIYDNRVEHDSEWMGE